MKAIHFAFACLLLMACGSNYKSYEADNAKEMPATVAGIAAIADSVNKNQFVSSSAAQVTKKDSSRKFIRTAEMKFRTANVYKSTYVIEDIVNKHNGFVTLSDLHSSVSQVNKTQMSADSILETTYYTTTNMMSMRVPNVSLDSVLREIASQISFLDFRVIKAEDVSLQMMANKWSEKRALRQYDRLENAIDAKAKKLRETTEAEENLGEKERLADNNKLQNLSFADRVAYSTINLEVYQREVTTKELLPDEKNIRGYEPSFLSKVHDSLLDGWLFLRGFVLFLMRLWPLVPIAIVFWILLRRYYRKQAAR